MILKADLHTHTVYSNRTQSVRWGKTIGSKLIDSKVKVEDLLKTARGKELDVISITDHDEIEGSLKAVELARKYDLTCIPGVEITTREGHLLAYGITKNVPTGLGALKAASLVHKMGGIVVAAHPFNIQGIFHSRTGKQLIGKVELDAIEVYSALKGDYVRQSIEYAKKYHFPQICGSDSKTLWNIGVVYTEIEVEKRDIKSILTAIKRGETKPIVVRKHNTLIYGLHYIYTNYFS